MVRHVIFISEYRVNLVKKLMLDRFLFIKQSCTNHFPRGSYPASNSSLIPSSYRTRTIIGIQNLCLFSIFYIIIFKLFFFIPKKHLIYLNLLQIINIYLINRSSLSFFPYRDSLLSFPRR